MARMGAGQSHMAEDSPFRPCISIHPEMAGNAPGAPVSGHFPFICCTCRRFREVAHAVSHGSFTSCLVFSNCVTAIFTLVVICHLSCLL